jgi:hypothetical protein
LVCSRYTCTWENYRDSRCRAYSSRPRGGLICSVRTGTPIFCGVAYPVKFGASLSRADLSVTRMTSPGLVGQWLIYDRHTADEQVPVLRNAAWDYGLKFQNVLCSVARIHAEMLLFRTDTLIRLATWFGVAFCRASVLELVFSRLASGQRDWVGLFLRLRPGSKCQH